MPRASFNVRKRLWKHIQACRAFDDAETAATLLLTVEQSAENLLEAPLWTALAVSYGRPFTHNEGVGPIDVALVPESRLPLHRMLVALRNKVSGHIDHTIRFDAGQVMNTSSLIWVEGNIRCTTSVVRPHIDVVPQILDLCQQMRSICEKEWQRIYFEVAGNDAIFDGKLIVNLSKDSDELFC